MYLFLRVCLIIVSSVLFIACSLDSAKNVPVSSAEYKYCNKYIKTMTYASNYILREFDEGYFAKKDLLGAKAQLFLIENNSPTIFAKNINSAKDSYDLNFQLAKKNSCDVKA
jgi:hypothetical protein